jgi:hypothetical protein
MDIRDLDMDAIVNRYELTFRRQNHDRPALHLSYPTGKRADRPPSPPSVRDRWFNFEWRIDCFERQLEEVAYLAEGFPAFWCNLGPDVLTGFTGSELDFSSDATTWAKFRVKDWSDEPPIQFQRHGWLWREMEKYLVMCAERGKGRWLTGSGDLHTNGDGLAALRGPQDLLMDLVDCPDEIKKRLAEFHEVFKQVLQAHFDIIHPRSDRLNSSWMAATCRGRYAVIQNDFCCMVGPAMFNEFFKEYVEKEAAFVDHSIYHLDGPGALCHIEAICASPHLDAVQWVPGAGNKALPEWPDVLKKIQSLGKGLWLYGSAQEAEAMMRYLKPEGCMYTIWCSSKEEAQALLKAAENIYGKNRG